MTEKVVTNRSVSAIVLQCYDCLLQQVKEIKLHLPTQTCCYHSSASYFLMSRTLKTSKHESWCLIWMTQLILILNCLYHHPTSNTMKHKCQQICNIHRLSNELLVNMMMRRFHWFCNIAILCVHLWYPVTIQSMCTTYIHVYCIVTNAQLAPAYSTHIRDQNYCNISPAAQYTPPLNQHGLWWIIIILCPLTISILSEFCVQAVVHKSYSISLLKCCYLCTFFVCFFDPPHSKQNIAKSLTKQKSLRMCCCLLVYCHL